MGRPTAPAKAEVAKTAAAVEHLCSIAPDVLAVRTVPDHDDGETVLLRSDPLGPVLGIMPWNFPYWQSIRFLVPALLAGNTILLKPAPSTTGSGLALQEAFDAAGLGDGLVTTLPIGLDAVAGLIGDRRLRGVSLTGSVRAGRSVGELAGRHLKKLVLELGGFGPVRRLPRRRHREGGERGGRGPPAERGPELHRRETLPRARRRRRALHGPRWSRRSRQPGSATHASPTPSSARSPPRPH